jgi:hypothetical protein
MPVIEEIKHHKNKPTQRFRCELVHRGTGHMVLRYRAAKAGRISDIAIAPGSTTIAHYWTDRGYVLWRMFDRRGRLIGTLLHICRAVTLTMSSVSYEDLILDIWIDPEGRARVLDADELEQCRQAGQISAAETVWIRRQRDMFIADRAAILREAEAFEHTHRPLAGD